MEMTVIQLPVCPAEQERSLENRLQSESASSCIRSLNGEPDSFVMVQPKSGLEASSKMWMSTVAVVMIVLQVASTAGLLLYLNMSMAQARNQGISEDVRCLGLLNALEDEKEVPGGLVHHFGEPCIRLADSIKTYISKVTENILSQRIFPGNITPREPSLDSQNTRGLHFLKVQPRQKALAGGNQRPSAHLTLRDNGLQGPTSVTPLRDLHVSCRHPVRSWGNQSFGSHLYNMTVSNGQLRIPQTGRYYLYTQVYFRYLTLSRGEQQSTPVVQCVYKKTAYPQPIQLLKGVGTKCWAPNSENTLHSIYQGGMFELRAGDEVFVSVSSPEAVHAEDSSSYFGAFRFDP